MTEVSPAIPGCSKGHGPMADRSARTAEQRFCGAWFECSDPWCRSSALIASPELLAQLDTQGGRDLLDEIKTPETETAS